MPAFVNLSRLRQATTGDLETLIALRQDWRDLLWNEHVNKAPEMAENFYSDIFLFAKTLQKPATPSLWARLLPFSKKEVITQADAYIFLVALGKNISSHNDNIRSQIHAKHRPQLQQIIRQYIDTPDRKISDQHLEGDTGYISDCARALLEFYCETLFPRSGPDATALQREAALLISDFLHAFPHQSNRYLTQRLENHPDAIGAAVSILDSAIYEKNELGSQVVTDLSNDVLSDANTKAQFFHRHGKDILVPLFKKSAFNPGKTQQFVNRLILSPLRCEPIEKETVVRGMQDWIQFLKTYKENPDPHVILDYSRDNKSVDECLEHAYTHLDEIEYDFPGWMLKRWDRAVQRIAVSSLTRDIVMAISEALHPYVDDTLERLLKDASQYKRRPKIYPIPDPNGNQFKDFGFKLLVIEELMYQQKLLTPKLDIHAFCQEYDKREICIYTSEEGVVPEVKTYFMNLYIPTDALSKVEQLRQSRFHDSMGGSEFTYHLYPAWFPEEGASIPFPVTDQAISDLALLPNLKRITGLENSKPSPKLLNALHARGITLIDEPIPEDDG